MSENLQAGDDFVPARSASLLVAHTSQTNALLAVSFELFFNSLVNRSKRGSSSSDTTTQIYARDITPQARILLSV